MEKRPDAHFPLSGCMRRRGVVDGRFAGHGLEHLGPLEDPEYVTPAGPWPDIGPLICSLIMPFPTAPRVPGYPFCLRKISRPFAFSLPSSLFVTVLYRPVKSRTPPRRAAEMPRSCMWRIATRLLGLNDELCKPLPLLLGNPSQEEQSPTPWTAAADMPYP